MKSIEIEVNFGGFYNSMHSEFIEDQIQALELDWEKVDYIKTHKNYAISWLDGFNSAFSTNMKFDSLERPRYYNYQTDKIIASVNIIEIQSWIKDYLKVDEFVTYVNERTTSRDGFISYYNGAEDLIDQAKINEAAMGLLFELILDYIIEIDQLEIVRELPFEINIEIFEL